MPVVRCATVALCVVITGCGKAPEEAAPPPSSPESYMRDKAFRDDLRARRAERGELQMARHAVVEKMKAMVDAKKKELGAGADDAAVRAALEKDPEWNSLYQRCLDANAAIGENLKKAQSAVRRRITPVRAADSKISK